MEINSQFKNYALALSSDLKNLQFETVIQKLNRLGLHWPLQSSFLPNQCFSKLKQGKNDVYRAKVLCPSPKLDLECFHQQSFFYLKSISKFHRVKYIIQPPNERPRASTRPLSLFLGLSEAVFVHVCNNR